MTKINLSQLVGSGEVVEVARLRRFAPVLPLSLLVLRGLAAPAVEVVLAAAVRVSGAEELLALVARRFGVAAFVRVAPAGAAFVLRACGRLALVPLEADVRAFVLAPL